MMRCRVSVCAPLVRVSVIYILTWSSPTRSAEANTYTHSQRPDPQTPRAGPSRPARATSAMPVAPGHPRPGPSDFLPPRAHTHRDAVCVDRQTRGLAAGGPAGGQSVPSERRRASGTHTHIQTVTNGRTSDDRCDIRCAHRPIDGASTCVAIRAHSPHARRTTSPPYPAHPQSPFP